MVIPLKANFGGEGGLSVSSALPLSAEYGTAGHDAPLVGPALLTKNNHNQYM